MHFTCFSTKRPPHYAQRKRSLSHLGPFHMHKRSCEENVTLHVIVFKKIGLKLLFSSVEFSRLHKK